MNNLKSLTVNLESAWYFLLFIRFKQWSRVFVGSGLLFIVSMFCIIILLTKYSFNIVVQSNSIELLAGSSH